MEDGDKIRCVDNGKVEHLLTAGKEYVALPPPQYRLSDTVYVLNDKGDVGGFYRTRFVKVEGTE